MNPTSRTPILPLFAAALGAVLPATLHAADTPPVYTTGDIFMGIRAGSEPAASAIVLVNLGPAATFRDATSPINLNLGNLGTLLTTTYGPDWYTRADLQWGVCGTPSNALPVNGDPAACMYASRQQVGSTPGTGYEISGGSTRASIATNIMVLQEGYDDTLYYPTVTADCPRAVIQDSSTAQPYHWAKFMAPEAVSSYTDGGKADFAGFTNLEGSSENGLGDVKLNLFRVISKDPASHEGDFTISAAGQVTFTPPSSTTVSYATWAATNAPSTQNNPQTFDSDYDKDGVSNGVEYFMGVTSPGYTSMPQISNGTSITWPRGTDRSVGSFEVQVSNTMAAGSWVTATSGVEITASTVKYTLPSGQTKPLSHFFRLKVNP